jgi:hypothetical protein
MSFDLERLYEFLPAVYRLRDIELAARQPESLTAAENAELQELQSLFNSGSPLTEPQFKRLEELQDKRRRGPLKALLAVIAEQAAVLEEDLARSYDDLFIETCAEWVVPYIGDLIGARGLFVFPNAQFSQRALVANEIALRRRKGTAAALEELARDATGWDASVVEYFQLLATTQYMNHLRPENLSFADLRHSRRLDYLNTPFDRTAHNADVRNIESRRGRYNIPNVGVFLWRLGSYSITAAPAYKLDGRRYLFDALGKDIQLYNHPEVEDEITHLAEPVNVPMPLSRRVLDRYLETYYGSGKSLLIYRDGNEVPISDVHVCDLSDVTDGMGNVTGWAHMPQEKIAIDPALGRVAFPSGSPPQAPPQSVRVSYHYGFSSDMGGGEYEREIGQSGAEKVIRVPSVEGPTLQAALGAIITALTNNTQIDGGVVEIEKPVSATASDYHHLSGVVNVPAGKRITVRAVDEHRPVVLLGGDLEIRGGADAELELNGLLISGGALRLPASGNQLETLRLAHCALPPGAAIGSPPGGAPSVVAQAPDVHIEVDRSIVGAIRATDGDRVCLTNSIVDAGDEDNVAYAGIDSQQAGAPLVTVNTTIIGRVHTLTMELASNTIFFAGSATEAPARAEMLQEGCVRFCYAPPGSRLPRQFECQPETQVDAARVRPIFTSLRYGDAGYCQLSVHCSEKIKSGADDGAEIGAFHDLYQPQRVANLRARLDEFLRFSLEAGIFMAS